MKRITANEIHKDLALIESMSRQEATSVGPGEDDVQECEDMGEDDELDEAAGDSRENFPERMDGFMDAIKKKGALVLGDNAIRGGFEVLFNLSKSQNHKTLWHMLKSYAKEWGFTVSDFRMHKDDHFGGKSLNPRVRDLTDRYVAELQDPTVTESRARTGRSLTEAKGGPDLDKVVTALSKASMDATKAEDSNWGTALQMVASAMQRAQDGDAGGCAAALEQAANWLKSMTGEHAPADAAPPAADDGVEVEVQDHNPPADDAEPTNEEILKCFGLKEDIETAEAAMAIMEDASAGKPEPRFEADGDDGEEELDESVEADTDRSDEVQAILQRKRDGKLVKTVEHDGRYYYVVNYRGGINSGGDYFMVVFPSEHGHASAGGLYRKGPFESLQQAVGEGVKLAARDRMRLGESKEGEGSRGGKVIGHTQSGRPIYASSRHPEHKTFSKQDHIDAAHAHSRERDRVSHEYHHVQRNPDGTVSKKHIAARKRLAKQAADHAKHQAYHHDKADPAPKSPDQRDFDRMDRKNDPQKRSKASARRESTEPDSPIMAMAQAWAGDSDKWRSQIGEIVVAAMSSHGDHRKLDKMNDRQAEGFLKSILSSVKHGDYDMATVKNYVMGGDLEKL